MMKHEEGSGCVVGCVCVAVGKNLSPKIWHIRSIPIYCILDSISHHYYLNPIQGRGVKNTFALLLLSN